MSQNGSQTTQTVGTQAPSWQQPFQQYGLDQSLAQFKGVNSPQQLVAGFSPQQDQAISGITNLATNNPTAGAADNYIRSVLNGNPAQNPYLSREFNLGANDVQNRLESEFTGAGRGVIGSAPVQADELNNLATQLYGGAYNTGVQQQENAAATAPSTISSDLGLNQSLFNAGGAVQGLAQQYIAAPQTFLNQYLSQVNGKLGSTQATSEPYSPTLNSAQNGVLGSTIGGTLGSSIAGLLGGSGSTGSNIGSLAGGLLGAFL